MNLRAKLRDEKQRFWLELARNGHEGAFRRLYEELYDLVRGYFSLRLKNPEEARDLTADVFLRFVEKLDRYAPQRGSVRTWIMTIARNAWIDHLRRRRALEGLESLEEEPIDGNADPLQQLLGQEDFRFANGILSNYPLETREMFALHFAQGLPYKEIARTLNLTESAVKQRFARTLRKLKQEMSDPKRNGGGQHATWRPQETSQENA